jgi:hypothetical protein
LLYIIGIQENLFSLLYTPNTPNVKAKHLKRITVAFALTHTHTHTQHTYTCTVVNCPPDE